MGSSAARRILVSGLGAGVLVGIIALIFAVAGNWDPVAFLPIATFQATWCFVEGCTVQKYRPLRPGPGEKPGVLPAATGFSAGAIAIIAVSEAAVSGIPAPAWVIAGFGVGVAGIVLRQFAIAELGPLFLDSIGLRDDHQKISTGIYRAVQHPAEIGFGLAMAGMVTVAGSLIAALLSAAVLVPMMGIRIAMENRLMDERFGRQLTRG